MFIFLEKIMFFFRIVDQYAIYAKFMLVCLLCGMMLIACNNADNENNASREESNQTSSQENNEEGKQENNEEEAPIEIEEVEESPARTACEQAKHDLLLMDDLDSTQSESKEGDSLPSVSYDAAENTIIVKEGSDMTLSQISEALGQPHLLLQLQAGEWLLSANLLIERNASVRLAAPDVHWLKLLSDEDGFSWVKVRGGELEINGTCITSWNAKEQRHDQNVEDGRSFVLARDGARMNIYDAELSYLGYAAGESYGVAWRLAGTSGELLNSTFGYNYYGLYSYEASGLVIRGNEVHHSIKYGIDPHTNSNQLLIEDNLSHHNGKHGIILAEGCSSSIIRNNEVHNNTLHGIVIYQQSNNNWIEGNTSYANGMQGININDSEQNTIRDNIVFDNTQAGIGVGRGSTKNIVSHNQAYENKRDGIYVFNKANKNTIEHNTVHSNTRYGIYLKSNDNIVKQNEVFSNEIGIYLRVDKAKSIKLENNDSYGNYVAEVQGQE